MSLNTTRKIGITSLALVAILFGNTAYAADENNVVPGFTAAGAPLGLHGVDPVTSIKIGNPIEGSAAFTAVHDDVAYYFTSADSMNTFKQNPAKYVPQNGGFCTFGVSVGKKFDGDPNYASVVDGKLYVFLNEEIFKLYQKDPKGTISQASKQWSKIKHTASSKL